MTHYSLEELRNLAPLYVQGRLLESEAADFESGLQQYPELKSELDAYASIADVYQDIEKEVAPPSPQLFDTILEKVEADERSQQAYNSKNLQTDSGNFSKTITDWFRSIFQAPQIGWGVAAVQCALIVLLLLPGRQQTTYQTLSASDPQVGMKTTLQLVFDEQTTEKEIRQVVQTLGGEITGGPSAEGVYQVGIKKDKDVDSIILTLRSKPNVLFIERKL